MKKILLIIILTIAFYAGYKYYLSNKPQINKTALDVEKFVNPQKITAQIEINSKTYDIEIADTDDKRVQGLSNRESLPENSGMLFVYENKEIWSFWMKDMKLPLDFIWIADDTVVDITENVPIPLTATYLPVYKPKQPVNFILEVNSGIVKRDNIKIGDKVKLFLPTPEPYL